MLGPTDNVAQSYVKFVDDWREIMYTEGGETTPVFEAETSLHILSTVLERVGYDFRQRRS